MLDALSRLITGLTAASVLVAVSLSLTPKGAGARMVRFVGGLTLTLTALGSFRAVPWEAWKPPAWETAITAAAEQPGEKVLASIIEDKTAAYILAKAQALGLDAEARVKSRRDENGFYLPESVRITIKKPFTEESVAALKRVLLDECGISEENQQIIRKE